MFIKILEKMSRIFRFFDQIQKLIMWPLNLGCNASGNFRVGFFLYEILSVNRTTSGRWTLPGEKRRERIRGKILDASVYGGADRGAFEAANRFCFRSIGHAQPVPHLQELKNKPSSIANSKGEGDGRGKTRFTIRKRKVMMFFAAQNAPFHGISSSFQKEGGLRVAALGGLKGRWFENRHFKKIPPKFLKNRGAPPRKLGHNTKLAMGGTVNFFFDLLT